MGTTAAKGLTAGDVLTVIQQAATSVNDNISIAVVDRVGNILGVFNRGSTPANDEVAVGLARTGAFFSHDQGPLSSELIRFLSRENFPEAVQDTGSADLFGIENTNRGCFLTNTGPGQFPFNPGKGIPPARNIDNTGPGTGIVTVPGGFPLFKGNRLVGGVGVFGATSVVNEYAGLTATTNYTLAAPAPGRILLIGIELPYLHFDVNIAGQRPPGTVPGAFPGGGTFRSLPDFVDVIPPGGAGPAGQLAYATAGTAVVANVRGSPITDPPFAPEGYLIGPHAGTQLTQVEVDNIVQAANAQANLTRAAIRLPPGQRCKMFFAVAEGIGGTALDGTPVSRGALLAYFRMPDATIFSGDVCSAKSRNVIYFSDERHDPADLPEVPYGIAITARTLWYGSQSMFPQGIKLSSPGPFRNTYLFDLQHPCTQGMDFEPATGIGPRNTFPAQNKSGIVFFPGSSIIYRNGILGGFGASGDGVNQDDVITDAGVQSYEAPVSIRADQVLVRGVRLPYYKFSRSPTE